MLCDFAGQQILLLQGSEWNLPISQESELHPIMVALIHLESMGVNSVAESQGGLRNRRHEEGLSQCVVELK